MLKLKRVVSLGVILSMLTITIGSHAITQDITRDEHELEEYSIEENVIFHECQQLPSLEDVSQFINDSIENGEIQNQVELVDEMIPLFDTQDRQYACYVPVVVDSDTMGYYIFATINGNITLMESTLDDDGLYTRIKSIESNEKIIYKFPSQFIINEDSHIYTLIKEGGERLNVTDQIDKFSSDKIINSIMKKDVQKGLSSNKNERKVLSTSESYNTALTDESNFVKIDNQWYGGHQKWLSECGYCSESNANKACAISAAANAICHMAKYKRGKCDLYTRGLSIKEFAGLMNDIYQYMSPAFYGIPGIGTVKSGVESFAASKGVALTGYLTDASWNKENTISYIRNGLKSDSPVLMNTFNSPIDGLSWHWVTITRIYKNSAGSNIIVTSNWDKRIEYNYDTWFDDYWSIYRGLIYFI